MFIRLFIKTTENRKDLMVINDILSCINEDNIKYKDVNAESYWKFDNTTVAEIQLELDKPLQGKKKEEFLNCISNKWLYLGEEEALSSVTMKDCRLNYGLEMINVFFN